MAAFSAMGSKGGHHIERDENRAASGRDGTYAGAGGILIGEGKIDFGESHRDLFLE